MREADQLTNVRITRDDMFAGARFNNLAVAFSRRTVAIAAGLGILGFAIFFGLAAGDPNRLLIALGATIAPIAYVYAIMLIGRYVAVYVMVRRQFREQRGLTEPHDISWDEAQLRVSGPMLKSQTAWSGYHKWRENERVFLLYVSSNLYQVLPKRWFSPAQAEEIRTALAKAGVRRAPLLLG